MDFVTVRELRAESAKVWEKLEAGEEVVVTRNGKPFALILHTEPNRLEETLRAVRAARFGAAVDAARQSARQQGLDKMTMEEIDAEIAKVRKVSKGRRGRAAGGR